MLTINKITTPDRDREEGCSGRWRKGTSGNPAGRPRGSRNQSTLALQQLLEDQGEELVQKLIALALEGDRYALRLCVDRILPSRKERLIELDLPPAGNFQPPSPTLKVLFNSVAAGQITPGEANHVANLLRLQFDLLKCGCV